MSCYWAREPEPPSPLTLVFFSGGRLDREMRTAPVLSNKRARPGGENQQGCTPDPRCATRPRSTGSLCSNQCHAALAQGAEKIHGKACADGIPSSPSPSQQPSQAFIGATSVTAQIIATAAEEHSSTVILAASRCVSPSQPACQVNDTRQFQWTAKPLHMKLIQLLRKQKRARVGP